MGIMIKTTSIPDWFKKGIGKVKEGRKVTQPDKVSNERPKHLGKEWKRVQ